ncbi:MAG: hypothetical protein ACRDHE_14350, partial [Ktedonobacterales bacterium]
MSDISLTALPRRPRRGSVDATATAARAAPLLVATPLTLWEQLAQRTQLAIIAFDERNSARLISPAAAALLRVSVEASIGAMADVVLATLRRESDIGVTGASDALLSPLRQDDAPLVVHLAHLGT